jgi:hypothetical protein
MNLTNFVLTPNPDEDATLAVRAVTEKIGQSKQAELIFTKGKYEFKDPQSILDFQELMANKARSIGRHTLGDWWDSNRYPYNVSMEFQDCDHLVIDGQGSQLIFHGLTQPFFFKDCRNIVLKNFTIDWVRPAFSEGRVVAADGENLEVEVFPDYPIAGGEPVWGFCNYDPEMGRFGIVDPVKTISPLELIRPQVAHLTYQHKYPVRVGDWLAIMHIGWYRAGAIYFLGCSNVSVEDVTIHSYAGSGLFAHRCHNISLKRYQVRPSGKRIMSTIFTASHFFSCTGQVEMEDCHYRGMGDDGTNIHSYYFGVLEKLDDRSLTAALLNDPQDMEMDYPEPGDKIEFVRRATLKSYFIDEVTSVEVDKDTWVIRIQLADPLPADFDMTDVLFDADQLAKLHMKGCSVSSGHSRGVSVQNRDVLIEGCTFKDLTGTGIHIDTEKDYWEAGGARNVIVRNSHFTGCGYGAGGFHKACGVAAGTVSDSSAVGVHRDILIENNYIKATENNPGIYLSCVDGAVVRNNKIEGTRIPVIIELARNVTVQGHNSKEVSIGSDCESGSIKVAMN